MTWHADTALIDRYATSALDDASALSVEAHLLACDACRASVRRTVPTSRVEAIWQEVEEVVDAPRPGLVERALRRLGLREHIARVLAATPSLRLSWLTAVSFALAFAVLAAHGGWGERAMLVFLIVAPLFPVAGTAVAFGPSLDPTFELSVATPMHSFRLLILRALAVLATSTVLAGAAGLLLPQLDVLAAAWVLPALGLTAVTLALATWLSPETASGLVAVAWVAAVLVTEVMGAGSLAAFKAGGPVESVAFQPAGQVAFAVLAAVAAAVAFRRRDSFELARAT